jgi:hypothetical protein
MFKLAPEKTVAALSFLTALGASLMVLPLLVDGQAFALDAKSEAGSQDGPQHHHLLPSETIEARLAYLKTALKITDGQAKQWNAVADLLRKQAKDKDAIVTAMRAYEDANLSAIDRLERRQKMMAKGAADLSDLIAVAQPLYASFSDEQKRLADEFLAPRFDGRGPGDRFRHHD